MHYTCSFFYYLTSIHKKIYLTIRMKRVAMAKISLVNLSNTIFLVIRNVEDIIITCNKQRPQNTDRPDHSHYAVNCLQLANCPLNKPAAFLSTRLTTHLALSMA